MAVFLEGIHAYKDVRPRAVLLCEPLLKLRARDGLRRENALHGLSPTAIAHQNGNFVLRLMQSQKVLTRGKESGSERRGFAHACSFGAT